MKRLHVLANKLTKAANEKKLTFLDKRKGEREMENETEPNNVIITRYDKLNKRGHLL